MIEMMVVLCLLAVMTSLILLKVTPAYQHYQIQAFIRQLEEDVLYAKQYALSHNEIITIYLDEPSHRYTMYDSNAFKPVFSREFSDAIHVSPSTMGTKVTLLANGNNQKAGKWFINYYDDDYQIIFSLGQGRVYAKKL